MYQVLYILFTSEKLIDNIFLKVRSKWKEIFINKSYFLNLLWTVTVKELYYSLNSIGDVI